MAPILEEKARRVKELIIEVSGKADFEIPSFVDDIHLDSYLWDLILATWALECWGAIVNQAVPPEYQVLPAASKHEKLMLREEKR